MISVAQLTEAIRHTIGTPFQHAGRVTGAGLDCGGMVIVALEELGYTIEAKKVYHRGDGLEDMVNILAANNFTQRKGTAISDVKPGDVVLIRTSLIYHHLVYFTPEYNIIHSWVYPGINKVVENRMLPEWEHNIHSIWRFNDLED